MSDTTLRTKIMKDIGDEFSTKTGIPQGDALSSILFAIYLEAIMRHHRETYPATGIQEDFTLQYADDTKFLIHSRELIPKHGPHQLACRCSKCETERLNTIELPASFQYGQMRLNTNKSKYGETNETSVPESFKFVGSYFDPNEEINARVMAANKAYYRMRPIMNSQSEVRTKFKVRLYNSIVKPVLSSTYGRYGQRKSKEIV